MQLLILLGFFQSVATSHILEDAASLLILNAEVPFHLDVTNNSTSFDLNSFLGNLSDNDSTFIKLSIRSSLERKAKFSLMIYDEVESFLKALESSNMTLDAQGFYVVAITSENEVNQSKIFKTLWKKSLLNVDILTKASNGSVELSTFFPFQGGNCHSIQPVTLNKFNGSSWSGQEFFPRKLTNFHNCTLKVGAAVTLIGFNLTKGSVEYHGKDYEIVKFLSKVLNFNLQVNFSSELFSFGEVFSNGTSYGVMSQVISGDSDMIIGNYFLMMNFRTNFVDNTEPYYFTKLEIIVPPGAPFTSFENLMRPFSLTLWWMVLLTITLIMLMPFHPRTKTKAQNFYYDLLVVIVGGSLTKLPTRNVPRILLMTIIILCLVMRTVYQAKMFNFFQAGDTKKVMKSLEDMEENEFNLYLSKFYEAHLTLNYPENLKRKVIGDYHFIDALIEKHLDPTFKGGMLVGTNTFVDFYKFNRKQETLIKMERPLVTFPVIIHLRKNSYLTEIVNEKLRHFKSAGLIEYWAKVSIEKYLKAREKKFGPEEITMKALLGAFQILVFGWLLSLIAFFIERCVFEIHRITLK